ncbi:MAG: hypothetical protein QXT64_02220 [Desulfurococcaceae archaeon]
MHIMHIVTLQLPASNPPAPYASYDAYTVAVKQANARMRWIYNWTKRSKHMIAPGETNLSWKDWLIVTIGFVLFTIPFIVIVHAAMEKISAVIPPAVLQSLIEKIEPVAPIVWIALVIINIIAIIATFYLLVRL